MPFKIHKIIFFSRKNNFTKHVSTQTCYTNFFYLALSLFCASTMILLFVFTAYCTLINLLYRAFKVLRYFIITKVGWGALWLIDRVLDLRSKDPGFKPHRRHCVVFLSKAH